MLDPKCHQDWGCVTKHQLGSLMRKEAETTSQPDVQCMHGLCVVHGTDLSVDNLQTKTPGQGMGDSGRKEGRVSERVWGGGRARIRLRRSGGGGGGGTGWQCRRRAVARAIDTPSIMRLAHPPPNISLHVTFSTPTPGCTTHPFHDPAGKRGVCNA